MGKNSKKRRDAKGKAGKQGSASVSLNSFRAGRALDSLAPAFVQWFDDGMPGAANAALEYLKLMEPVLSRYLDATATADITNLDPPALAGAVAQAVTDADAGQDADVPEPERAAYIVDAVRSYVEFLSETHRWTGTTEQLAKVLDFFEGLAENGQSGIEVPEIPLEQALAEFSALPLIRKATALLQWIGDGKPVTGTGALRLRDIEAAAACVGVAATGETKDERSSGDALVVRSMYEVPLLARLWAVLQDVELISIKPTKAMLVEGPVNFLAGGPAQQLDEFKKFTGSFLRQAVLRLHPEQPWESTVAAVVVSLLLAAASPEPPLVERFLAAPDHAPEPEQEAAVELTKVAMGRLQELADLGLLTIDTHFRVPPVLIGCVAGVFDDPELLGQLGLGKSLEDEMPAVQAG